MAGPSTLVQSIPGTSYTMKVDTSKADCNREPPHCHIYNIHGTRIAQVWATSPATFASIPDGVSRRDLNAILDTVTMFAPLIVKIYNINKVLGSD
jgi:hypothetical protein